MAATATVAGVEVSTEHWIGGVRVGSRDTFEDRSPIDETLIARVARGREAHHRGALVAGRQLGETRSQFDRRHVGQDAANGDNTALTAERLE